MSIQGLRTTANFVTDQRPKNWRETILLLYPNGKAPLTALTSLLKSEAVDDPEFNWWEKPLSAQRYALAAAISDTSSTTINLSDADAFKELKDGTLLLVEATGEIMYVNADPTASSSISVVRGFSGSTPATLAVGNAGINPYVLVIGSAYEEGSLDPTGVNRDPTKKFNYCQIWRNTLEMTRTASKTRLRTGDQVKEAKRECLEFHSMEIEKSLWFGKRVETTKNGKPLRTTGGLISFIDSNNVVDRAGVAASMTDLEDWLEQAFRFGSSEKVGYCGNACALAIQRIIRRGKNVNFNIQNGVKEYGMNVTRITTPFGELVLKTHPLWNQYTGGTVSSTAYYGINSWLAIIDQANLKWRYVKGDDMRYEKDLQANGLDGMKSGYITEGGLEIWHPTTHFLIKGLATAGNES